MSTIIKIILGGLFIAGMGFLSRSEFKDVKADECCPYQSNGGQCVDSCMCGYCQEVPANECDTLIADETWEVGEDSRNLVFTYNDEVRGILSKVGKTVDDFKEDSTTHCTWFLLPQSVNARKLLTSKH